MLRRLLAVSLFALCLSNASFAQQSKSPYSGGDGSTRENAIVVTAAGTVAGVDAEYRWIEDHLPGATIESTSLIAGKPAFDVFEVTLPSGDTRTIYFDISSFFGKQFPGNSTP